jgi:hypothetical protein
LGEYELERRFDSLLLRLRCWWSFLLWKGFFSLLCENCLGFPFTALPLSFFPFVYFFASEDGRFGPLLDTASAFAMVEQQQIKPDEDRREEESDHRENSWSTMSHDET